MRKVIAAVGFILACYANVVHAEWIPAAFEKITVSTFQVTTVTTATIPTSYRGDGVRAYMDLESADIRYTWLGSTAPNTGSGHKATAGDRLLVEGRNALLNFKAMGASGTNPTVPVLWITYEKEK